SFVLRNSAGTVIPATVTYVDATRTVTLDPTSDLSGNTTYTATISGVKDLAGNTLASPFTWSFTTGVTVHTWTQNSATDFAAGTQSSTVAAGGDVRLLQQTSFLDD